MANVQIHELNSHSGSIGSSDYLATDNGTNTTKIPASDLILLKITVPSFNSLPQTVANASITSDMIVVKAELGTPEAQVADWTVTTTNGSLTVNGTDAIEDYTTLTLYLERSR